MPLTIFVFWELYSVEKMRPKEIMQRLGFDVEVLGADRISQIPRLLKAQLDEYGDFHEERKPTIIPTPKSIENPRALRIDPQTAIQLEKMQHELEYVKQELEFIKKNILVDKREQQKK